MSHPYANQKSWNSKSPKQTYHVNAYINPSQPSKPNHNGSQNFHKPNISTENTIPAPLRGYNIITWKKAAKSYLASNNCTDAIKFESFRAKCLALAENAYETDEQDLINYLQTYQVEISQFKSAIDSTLINIGLPTFYTKSQIPTINQQPNQTPINPQQIATQTSSINLQQSYPQSTTTPKKHQKQKVKETKNQQETEELFQKASGTFEAYSNTIAKADLQFLTQSVYNQLHPCQQFLILEQAKKENINLPFQTTPLIITPILIPLLPPHLLHQQPQQHQSTIKRQLPKSSHKQNQSHH